MVSVSSGTPFLGVHAAAKQRVLIFCAEDDEASIKTRLQILCGSRGITLADLDLRVIRTGRLNLCDGFQFEVLARIVAQEKPSLLVLDPFVRVFSGNEDDSSQVSRVLGLLRKLQRETGTSILLVHHFRKGGSGTGGAYLRGSGDLHAWGDSNLYMRPCGVNRSSIHIEHRGHPTPTPFLIELSGEPLRLRRVELPDKPEAPVQSVRDRILKILGDHEEGIGRGDLRELLGMNNKRVGDELEALRVDGLVDTADRKWMLCDRSVPGDL